MFEPFSFLLKNSTVFEAESIQATCREVRNSSEIQSEGLTLSNTSVLLLSVIMSNKWCKEFQFTLHNE